MAYQLSSDDILRTALLLGGMGAIGTMAANRGSRRVPTGAGAFLLQSVAQPGMNLAAGAPSAPGGEGGVTQGDIQRMMAEYGEEKYPRRFYPNRYHTVNVDAYDGPGNAMNNGLDRPKAEKAGHMQSLKEHNDTIFQYVKPGMNPIQVRQAIMRGIDEEEKLPAFWADDKTRKGWDFHPNSTAISAMRITPDARIEVKWQKPSKNNPDGWYTFKQFENTYEAAKEMSKLINSESLGQAAYPYHRLKKPKGNLGWWNQRNYDSTMVPG